MPRSSLCHDADRPSTESPSTTSPTPCPAGRTSGTGTPSTWGRHGARAGPGAGFAPGQVQFANGGRIEMLMPNAIETNDFLSRFLTRHGPGPHHLTFKVPDLDTALDAGPARRGIEPIGIDLSDPRVDGGVHPPPPGHRRRRAAGPGPDSPWAGPPPDDYPTERRLRKDGSGPCHRPRSTGWPMPSPTWGSPPRSSSTSSAGRSSTRAPTPTIAGWS